VLEGHKTWTAALTKTQCIQIPDGFVRLSEHLRESE
jgi:hypothetical protein